MAAENSGVTLVVIYSGRGTHGFLKGLLQKYKAPLAILPTPATGGTLAKASVLRRACVLRKKAH